MLVIGLFRFPHLHPFAAFEDIVHFLLLDSLHLPCWHFIFFSLSFVWYASCLHALFFFFLIKEKYPCPLPVLCFNGFKTVSFVTCFESLIHSHDSKVKTIAQGIYWPDSLSLGPYFPWHHTWPPWSVLNVLVFFNIQ